MIYIWIVPLFFSLVLQSVITAKIFFLTSGQLLLNNNFTVSSNFYFYRKLLPIKVIEFWLISFLIFTAYALVFNFTAEVMS